MVLSVIIHSLFHRIDIKIQIVRSHRAIVLHSPEISS